MTKEFHKHPADYMFLVGILTLFTVGYFSAGKYIVVQQAMAVNLGIAYFIWGIVHHRNLKMLTPRIMLEYFFVGLLATTLLVVINL